MGINAFPSTQLGRVERELEVQIKESLEDSKALRQNFEDDLEYVRQDAMRRLAERNRHAKQQQLVASAREVCLARERIFQLESDAQSMRLSPPQVVERIDPGTAIEVMRLRDKVAAREEQARRALKTAAEAQEAVGRESAISQGLQQGIDNARHRLLTVQGTLAEVSEENTGLRRELEGERIKTAAGSRRLADTLSHQQQEHASEVESLEKDVHGALARLSEARRQLGRLRDSRETVADLAVSAYRRRRQATMIAAAAAEGGEKGGGVQAWCFWSWARAARDGSVAVARRARRAEAEKQLPGVKEMLSQAVERARGAEAERDRHGETAEALIEEISRRTTELEATQTLAFSVKNRYARLGTERLHKTLEQIRRDRVASAFWTWIDAGTGPEVAQKRTSRSTVARPEDFGTTSSNRGVVNDPPAAIVAETREAATSTLHEGAEEGETARKTTPTPTPCVAPSNACVKEEGRDTTNTTGATNYGNKAPVSISTPGNRLGSNRRPILDPDQVVRTSTPETEPCEETEDLHDRDHVVGGFPFPVTSSPAHSTTPADTAANRPAPVTEDANASFCNNSSSEVFVAVAHPDGGGGGSSAKPDPPRVMLALRAAVGNELYAVGESLLRCVEADHREIQGRAYRPIPVTGAERDQFHVCLHDATRGPLRRAVLRFLRVQESYRAAAVERDREGWRVEHGSGRSGGGGGGGGGVRNARCKSKGAQRVKQHQYKVSSLTTGALSSPAEKARAARVLRDLTVPLLSDAEDAWARHRQPWQRTATASGLSGASPAHFCPLSLVYCDKMTLMKISSATVALLVLLPGVSHGQEITTCEELQAAFERTQTGDVTVEIHPFADIECAAYTNMTMSSNTLNVTSSEDLSSFHGHGMLRRVRFEVTNGARLYWETNTWFDGVEDEDEQMNDGGAVYVGEGSTVHFLNDVEMSDVSIINERDGDSDFAIFVRSGGCVWTNGHFRVDGDAIFTHCDITGAGESPPGPGGAIYVGETGSVLFNGQVSIAETYITDDFGGDGGAIYNLGTVDIQGTARFQELSASEGGAIYNGENAVFNFGSGASALFMAVSNRDARGSALYNLGYFAFSGPAFFVDMEAPVIVAQDGSETIISEDSAFWDLDHYGGEAIDVGAAADIIIPDTVTFVGFAEPVY
eukprot:g8874.t1